MTKVPARPIKKEVHKTKTLREVLEEIKTEILQLEDSSHYREFRDACRAAVAVIEKHINA